MRQCCLWAHIFTFSTRIDSIYISLTFITFDNTSWASHDPSSFEWAFDSSHLFLDLQYHLLGPLPTLTNLSSSLKVFIFLPSPSLSLKHLCNLRVHLHASFRRTTPFLTIATDPHGHLTHAYFPLLLLSQLASHKPQIPVTVPPFYCHVSHYRMLQYAQDHVCRSHTKDLIG